MNFKLFYESKESDLAWMSQFQPLKGSRVMGAIMGLNVEQIPEVKTSLNEMGYQTVSILSEDANVVFYKKLTPEIQKGLKLFKKYLIESDTGESKNKRSGLTKEEHRFLGKLFGYSKSETKWFVDELWPEDVKHDTTVCDISQLSDATGNPVRIGWYRNHIPGCPDMVCYWDGKKAISYKGKNVTESFIQRLITPKQKSKKYISHLYPVKTKYDFIPVKQRIKLTGGEYEAASSNRLHDKDVYGDEARKAKINPFKLEDDRNYWN